MIIRIIPSLMVQPGKTRHECSPKEPAKYITGLVLKCFCLTFLIVCLMELGRENRLPCLKSSSAPIQVSSWPRF